jgi:ubiquinone/menaquinone biosynthesis C-methylase UbiE
MSNRVCPWWLGPLLASRVRRWLGQDPVRILSPYVREGMTVLEPGPGMGFFTIPLAQLVGASGRVIAVELQPRMIAGLKKRAQRAGVSERIETRACSATSMQINDLFGKVDFTLAFAIVHEFPDADHLFGEIARASKPQAHILIAEPKGHVDELTFAAQLKAAAALGLHVEARPKISRSHAALLVRS